MRPAGQFPGDGSVCKPHVQGVCLAQSIQRKHSLYKPECLAIVCIKSQLLLMKTNYVSGTELRMLLPFISSPQNRLYKEDSIISILDEETERWRGNRTCQAYKLARFKAGIWAQVYLVTCAFSSTWYWLILLKLIARDTHFAKEKRKTGILGHFLLKQWFSNLRQHQNHLESCALLRPTPRDSESEVGVGPENLHFCKFSSWC